MAAREGVDDFGSAAESAVDATDEATKDKAESAVEAASTFCGAGEDDDGEEEGAAEGFATTGDDRGGRGPVVTRVPPPKRTRVGSAESEEESLLKVEKRPG